MVVIIINDASIMNIEKIAGGRPSRWYRNRSPSLDWETLNSRNPRDDELKDEDVSHC